ncbi:NAD(P)-dependent alcohol dehydrogenase [Streptomyces sp. NBC_01281]|uniref:zinc-dependent alcohol dehydrogenase family protein n=1 Tax=unclassified Streptomyces TaxID=2593676 RepID=UPI0022589E7F|nr:MULTISPECIES: NAD(P)-dependent alcohol dehydrogenase [unclassified Streptomyces]MCX4914422.1 NAD(P)-dependent alcohol dehydrogenase [Streptomyces sp. NBC_00687]MCX5283019.1 NAD(P)-dependent alcohol dehydrogenase [Streptomyces sp. NBC_00198]WSK63567.1 NAD(P)-dependent alcohol dehydrogenase [Streptomyces sp. NBC_01281]
MRAYHLETPGTVDGIVPREQARPEPGPRDILVRVRAASLNKRDLLILRETYPLKAAPDVIPVSDGAGEVVAVGAEVTRFAVGDRVAGTYFPNWLDGRITPDRFDQPGATLDGMLTEYARLDQEAAVRVPDHLTWEEAACLPCAGVTAWHSLTGGEALAPGHTVLTLGTGALSLFVVRFAKMLGAEVVATTSSPAKADRLRALGADHVVDYAAHPEWGLKVRELTGGRGADLVVETNGPETIEQSVRAAALYAQIVLLITGSPRRPGIEISNAAYAGSLATIRRVFVGSRAHFESMNRALRLHGVRPVVDRVFGFDEVREAYRYYESGAAFGKVVVRVG